MRTTNSNLRANSWFETPSEKIVLKFSDEKVKYSIEKGIKKGRYVINLAPLKSSTEDKPNEITVEIDGKVFG